MTPFGSDRFPSEVTWATHSDLSLFPPPLDLEALDKSQAKVLRTWFVAHVEITPRKTTRRKNQPQPIPNEVQLKLL